MSEDAIEEIRAEVERLEEARARLEELGERENLPVVERTAKRVEGTLSTLKNNLPPELEDG